MIDLSQFLNDRDTELLQRGSIAVKGVATNSNDVRPGDLFFALPGKRRDGHEFIDVALASGAAGAVVTKPVKIRSDATLILVPDAVEALQRLGAMIRQASKAKVIAITGSAGKTTTKDMVAHALGGEYGVLKSRVLKSRASFNNYIGVPLTLAAIRPEHTHVIAELGTNHPGEISRLGRIVAPDMAVITNVGLAHVGNFGSQDAIAIEKGSLLDHVRIGGSCVINGDDPRLIALTNQITASKRRVLTVGFGSNNHLRARDIRHNERGTSGVLDYDGEQVAFTLNVTGRHFVYALLLAVAVSLECGMQIDEVVTQLEKFDATPGRCSVERVGSGVVIVDDSHNASPDAMFAALDLLESLPGTVKIAALGEMKELGEQSDHLHQLVGSRVSAVATHLVTVGAGGSEMQSAALENDFPPDRVWSAKSASHALDITKSIVGSSKEHCAILVKGSRFTHMERVTIGLGGTRVACDLENCSLFINCRTCPQLGSP